MLSLGHGVNSSICCSVSLPLHVIEAVTGQKKNEVKVIYININCLED